MKVSKHSLLIFLIYCFSSSVLWSQEDGLYLINSTNGKEVFIEFDKSVKINFVHELEKIKITGRIKSAEGSILKLNPAKNIFSTPEKYPLFFDNQFHIPIKNITKVKVNKPVFVKALHVISTLSTCLFGYSTFVGVALLNSRPDLAPSFLKIGGIGLSISLVTLRLTKSKKYKIKKEFWNFEDNKDLDY